jgi:hypothetical protein
MSAAQVVNTVMMSPAARISQARGSVATGYQSVDSIDTNLAARGRDDFARHDDFSEFETPRPHRRRGEFQDQVVRFAGVLLSRDVGATVMQAQAAASASGASALTPAEAERNVAMYEFNQSLMGTPEVTTQTGMMH